LREDLFFWLAVIPNPVPPRRARSAHTPLVVHAFADVLGRGRMRLFSYEAVDALARHPFPGNVRVLRNLVEWRLILNAEETIGAAHVRAVLPDLPDAGDGDVRLADAVRAFERRAIERAIAEAGGNVTHAAARLGLERSHLYKKMKKLGMSG
jgi:two-component system nitrogen regulation response regulator NtrX